MKVRNKNILIVLLISHFLSIPYFIEAQQSEKEKLQKDKQRIENEIDYTNKLLTETQRTRQTSLNQLALLNRQVKQRGELLNSINSIINAIDRQIKLSSDSIIMLQNELQRYKDEYARLIVAASKHRSSYEKLMFVFSADDFNQAYKRIKYLQQYSEYRKSQAEKIRSTEAELSKKIIALELQRAGKVALRNDYEREKQQLAKERNKQNESVQNLSKKEKELLAKLRENERALNRLQKAIEKIIAEEIRLARETAKKTGTVHTGDFALTPEEKLVSSNMEANKGKLPWPTERGVIGASFGTNPHPVLKGIKTQNNGIDIITHKGAEARAVFEGEIANILTIPSLNNVVIIKHGDFLTVYSNLDQVFVKRGDKVTTRQNLGVIHTDNEEVNTKLHFEIWKGKELQNPEHWIARGKAM